MPEWDSIASLLAAAGIDFRAAPAPVAVAGGDISAAWHVTTGDGRVFLKTGPKAALAMFSAEQDALAELADTATVKVPRPLALQSDGGVSLLVLEWLELDTTDPECNAVFGRQLAELHRVTAGQHGWHRDNFIGRTPQRNPWRDDWPTFFRDFRIGYQLELAAQAGHRGELQESGEWLCDNLDALFEGYEPPPSLLHGDLWSGNWAACDGAPVMFDPASYFGDRETDLAMTRLFGGFSAEFYRAYEAAWPLAAGAEQRQQLYQLYHVLNHLNLFGTSYLGRALALIKQLRRAIER